MPRTARVRASASLGAAALLVTLVACGDARLKGLSAGISSDSTLKVMGTSVTGADSFSNVHERAKYFSKGQSLDVFFYTRGGDEAAGTDVPDDKLTPIVIQDGKLAGWGWRFWDSVRTSHQIQRRPSSKPGEEKRA